MDREKFRELLKLLISPDNTDRVATLEEIVNGYNEMETEKQFAELRYNELENKYIDTFVNGTKEELEDDETTDTEYDNNDEEIKIDDLFKEEK